MRISAHLKIITYYRGRIAIDTRGAIKTRDRMNSDYMTKYGEVWSSSLLTRISQVVICELDSQLIFWLMCIGN